jgi:hypothetical protein
MGTSSPKCGEDPGLGFKYGCLTILTLPQGAIFPRPEKRKDGRERDQGITGYHVHILYCTVLYLRHYGRVL